MEVYSPPKNPLLDMLLVRNNLRNDAALGKMLDVRAAVLSKIRHNRIPVGATLVLTIHEKTGMPVAEIRALLPAAKG